MRHRRTAREWRLRSAVAAVVVVAALLWLARTFVAVTYTVPSRSMATTLVPDDRILVNRLAPALSGVQRGDVVVFDATEAFGAPGTDSVKRVVAVGGDRVSCCDERGRLLLNGDPLSEPYLFPGDRGSQLRFDVEVPDGRLWVMGDHRSASRDSRAHLGAPGGGTVDVDDLVGSVVAVVWPPDRVGTLS